VRATDQAGRNATVPGFAARFGDRRPAVAINGDFFDYAAYQPRGLAVGPSGPWIKCGARELCSDENPDVPGTSTEGVFAFGGGRYEIRPQHEVTRHEGWMAGAVSGWPVVLFDGALTTNAKMSSAHCTARHPRTAVGLSADRRTLFLFVVDGRRSGSVGMTCAEVGRTLARFGADRVLSLDGGGSTTMWMRGAGVVNEPSDGSPRYVANHLGVFAADVGTRGTFTGVVHPYGLPGHRLVGAKVRMVGVGIEEADGEGEVHFRVPGGRYTLEVSVPGFTKRTLEVAVPPDHAVTERLWVAARADNDDDGWPNDQDNCPNDANPQQTDDDRDGIGNRCDLDADDDGVPDADDRCPRAPDPAQEDMDDDGFGAACDANDADPVVH
jgi:hypothetical protein